MSTRAFVAAVGAFVVGVGCVNQVRQAVAREPEGGGTLTCHQIVEQCDSTCSDPLCLHGCSAQGTDAARGQHDAVLSCGESAGCTDEECMRASCPTEVTACMGPEDAPPAPPPTESTPPPPAPPAQPAPPAPPAPPVSSAGDCGSHTTDWCPAPAGDPCGAHKNEQECRADTACRGLKYSGESVVACHHDGKGFWTNCPAVGCISR